MIQPEPNTLQPYQDRIADDQRLLPARNAKSSDDEDAPQGNPLVYVQQALRGRLIVTGLLACLLATAGASVGFFAKRPAYTSSAIVQVSANKQGILYEDQDDSRLRLFDAFVSSEASYLGSRPVLERTLTQPDLEQLQWEPSADSFRRLREAVKIDSKGGLITVACESGEPETAAVLVNAVIDAYQELHLEHIRREDSVRERQLARREKELLVKVEQLKKQMQEVGQEYGLQSIASAHVRKIAQIQEVDQRVSELETTVASREAADALSEVDTGDVEIKRLVVLDHALADMLFERTKRAASLSSLTLHLGQSHTAVKQATLAIDSIDASIEDRRSQLATLGTTGALTKSGKAADDESLQGLRALLTRLKSRVDGLRDEARELNSRLIQLEFLGKEREQLRFLLDETRKALEEVRVESQNTLPGTIEVRARGSIPTQPSSDKRKVMAAAGAGGGGVAAFALILGVTLVTRRLRFSDEVSGALSGYTLAGVLPQVKGLPQHDARFNDAVHRLRNQLQLSSRDTSGSEILVTTGIREGSGSSTVALALAHSFAETRAKTAVVDADLISGALTTQLGLSNSDGLREAIMHDRLNGEVRSTVGEHLFALPSGRAREITDHRVSRTALGALFQRLRDQFDVVIIDVGTCDHRLAAGVAAALADQVVLVVPSGTPARDPIRLTKQLEDSVNSLRVVFNFAPDSDPAFASNGFRSTVSVDPTAVPSTTLDLPPRNGEQR